MQILKTRKMEQALIEPETTLVVEPDLMPPKPDRVQIHRTRHSVDDQLSMHEFINNLQSSIQSMNPELAFRECRETYDREFFAANTDSALKAQLVSLLCSTFGDRLPLWVAMKNRSPDVLDLI